MWHCWFASISESNQPNWVELTVISTLQSRFVALVEGQRLSFPESVFFDFGSSEN